MEGTYIPFKFNEDEEDIEGDSAPKVKITYRKDNTSEYIYNEEEKSYTRYKDGKLHIDESDESPIIAKNIIIQRANTKVLDNEGRLQIDLVGNGQGFYITNGKVIEVTWKKDTREGKTLYYDLQGDEIILNPGVTWIQVVEPKTSISFEEEDSNV